MHMRLDYIRSFISNVVVGGRGGIVNLLLFRSEARATSTENKRCIDGKPLAARTRQDHWPLIARAIDLSHRLNY